MGVSPGPAHAGPRGPWSGRHRTPPRGGQEQGSRQPLNVHCGRPSRSRMGDGSGLVARPSRPSLVVRRSSGQRRHAHPAQLPDRTLGSPPPPRGHSPAPCPAAPGLCRPQSGGWGRALAFSGWNWVRGCWENGPDFLSLHRHCPPGQSGTESLNNSPNVNNLKIFLFNCFPCPAWGRLRWPARGGAMAAGSGAESGCQSGPRPPPPPPPPPPPGADGK